MIGGGTQQAGERVFRAGCQDVQGFKPSTYQNASRGVLQFRAVDAVTKEPNRSRLIQCVPHRNYGLESGSRDLVLEADGSYVRDGVRGFIVTHKIEADVISISGENAST